MSKKRKAVSTPPGDQQPHKKKKIKWCVAKHCYLEACVGNFCGTHTATDAKKNRYCIAEGCYVSAYFGVEDNKPTHCVTHMTPLMRNVKDQKCQHPNCGKLNPAYGFVGESPRFCKDHQLAGMKNLKMKTCKFEGCKTIYLKWGYTCAEYCSKHKAQDMRDFKKRKQCSYEGCTVYPYFNFKGLEGKFCDKHRKVGMISVKITTCAFIGCSSQCRSFNYVGLKGKFCAKHRTQGMVNVKGKCLFEGCTMQNRNYGFPGKPGQFCLKHKLEGMVNVRKKPTCNFPGCELYRQFGVKGGRALFCSQHKQDSMIRIGKTCLFEDCSKTYLKYGNHITGRAFCIEHRDVAHHWKLTTCKENKCRHVATHSKTGSLPFMFCDDHAPQDFSSCKEKKCLKCGFVLLCDSEQHCLLSCSSMHKDYVKRSENAMNDFFIKKKLTFTRDSAPDHSCTKRRPDFVFRTAFGVVIVENDENQHKSNACTCEQSRMIELHQSFGESVHFIRFNPDRFVQSATGETGFVDLNLRHRELYHILQSLLKQPGLFFSSHPGLTVRYMYYDECDTCDSFNNVKTIVY